LGFSLLELIIAIFVLTVGITAALQLIVSTIKTSIDTRNSVVASGLAQEGVELVRNIRDNNLLYALSDLSINPDVAFKRAFPAGNGDNDCSVDINYVYPNNLACSGNSSIYLSNTGIYSHTNSGTPTIFRRNIKITYVANEMVNGNASSLTGMNVWSTVWWDGTNSAPFPCNQGSKCIEVTDYLAKRD
jgi:Tfp pilus assembly protein PilV